MPKIANAKNKILADMDSVCESLWLIRIGLERKKIIEFCMSFVGPNMSAGIVIILLVT
jgi:hypothetical protein